MTGCHMTNPYEPTDSSEATKAAAALTALPALEDTERQLTAAIEQIGQQAAAIVPGLAWHWHREASRGGCNPPYEQSEGQLILLPNYVSDTPIPDENWNQVLVIAKDAATKFGATNMEVFHGAPGFHDVRFYNDTGTDIRLGSQKAALISGSTGCRLPRNKK